MESSPSFFARILLAFFAFFAVLFDRRYATTVRRLRLEPGLQLPPPRAELPAAGEAARAPEQRGIAQHRDSLHLLSVLQRDGRLVDFLQEDLAQYPDDQVGAAARAVHEGCRKSLQSYFELEPVYREPEGADIAIPQGFDAAAVRLTGNVVGNPPFRGTLKHAGWRVREVKLPSAPDGINPAIVAPAEVELP